MAQLGQYALKAEFYFGGGRQKLAGGKRSSPSYTPFDLTVGGVPIPHLSADERKQLTGKADLDTLQANPDTIHTDPNTYASPLAAQQTYA